MNIILQKAVFNEVKIKNYISKLTVNELNNLAEPCYYPEWQKHLHELLAQTQLTEKDIRLFIKRFYSGTNAQDSLLQSDVGSNFLVIMMYYFLEKKDIQTYSTLMIYHMIRQYGNYIRKVMKFCKPEVFTYTLNHLNPSHLFSREKTVSNALFHLATEMRKRYTSSFSELNAEKISSFLYESRSRIAQSLRSFAQQYYSNVEKGMGISSTQPMDSGEVVQPQELEKGKRLAELVASKICVYKEIDYDAFNKTRSLTRINLAMANIIIRELQNTIFLNDIKFIIELFLKDVKSVNDLCGKNFIPYVKKLMSIKRTLKEVYFKQEVNKLLIKIIKNTKFESKYNKLTSQTQFQFNSFLAFYLAYYTRNLVC